MPTKANVVDLVKSIEKLANDSSASLSAVQIGETFLSDKVTPVENSKVPMVAKHKNGSLEETFASVVPVPFVFTVEGDYGNIANLVAKAVHLPRLMSTEGILLTKGVGRVIATFRLSAYYLPLTQ